MELAKKNVGAYAADLVKPGMVFGLGSGTTVYWLVQELATRISQGLEITAVPTSEDTKRLAEQAGLKVTDLNEIERLELTIDGADEIDPRGRLIKGGGGALLQEKIVAAASKELIIIADSSKLVASLGKFPLPVEVIPFGYKQVEHQILDSGICNKINLRKKDGKAFVSDHHHYILDCECEKIVDAASLNISLHLIPGVVETGLFIDMANKALIGYEDGRIEMINFK